MIKLINIKLTAIDTDSIVKGANLYYIKVNAGPFD